jgi:hypothetical protein
VSSAAAADDPQLGDFTSLLEASSAQSPGAASDLPAGVASRPAGEFTQIFGAPGAAGPLSFGQNASAGAYTNRQEPGEFTQIFGREMQTAAAAEPSPGRFEPTPGTGAPNLHDAGASPLPSAKRADAPPSAAQRSAALPEIKPPEAPAPGKPAMAASLPAVPKLPPPPSVPVDKLPKTPVMAAPAKPAAPPAPKLPPPKIPAAPTLRPQAPAAAPKMAKPRKSYLPLVLIFAGLLVVATAMILYFALTGH